MTIEGDLQPPRPINEPVWGYEPGSPERADLKKKLDRMASEVIEIPIIIGGVDYTTGDTADVVMPHDHAHVLARYHKATDEHIQMAVDSCMEAWKEWSNWPWQDRAAVFLKAADLLAGDWRQVLNASTMLGQSKTCYQAEIDAACEIIDFWRFNTWFGETSIYAEQPPISPPGVWNRMEARPLDGFV
ncbi:MAG: aldehyde dehydrogenase family protein, partial [Gemmatimonadetes bacterium]|nr:aldehyde dehydrogenase family protein [Gemmatimonadota bacterium]